MKTVLVCLILSLLVIGCDNNNDSGSDSEQNNAGSTPGNISLPGTWRYTQVHRFFNDQTNEYLYTDYFESTLIFVDDENTIRYYDCWEYGSNGAVAIQTADYIYLNTGTTAFARTNDGSYITEEETNMTYPGMTGTYFNQHFELTKISDDVNIDSGMLILTGNISVSEYNHVCLLTHYSNTFDRIDYELIVPHDDLNLALKMDFTSTPIVGTYDYSNIATSPQVIYFDVISNSTLFWDTINSNSLAPNPATINITASSDTLLNGTFSFTGQDNGDYSGEFQIDLTTLR